MYTIGQVSVMFSLPISTLRYYDKEGLFPNIERQSGIRKFSENEIEALRVIECLKASGLEIKDIKQFMDWVKEGESTYEKRKNLFEARKKAVEEEIANLQKMLDMVKFKCWYYETAIKDGGEEKLNKMLPDKLPKDIQKLYDNAHS
ncbi:MAG: MerR family transcriptional regulator [Eubacterium sp.]|nr:MerR family transcriptional regulator [Eubacterium sp.]